MVAAGHPRIFNGEDCNAFTWFSPAEESRLNATADLLNSKIQAAAHGAGVFFSSPTSAFVGHAVCDKPEWINGLSSPTSESFHPNRLGHSSGYAPLVGSTLTGTPVALSPSTTSKALASAERLTTQQRKYAVQDRTIRPKVFTAPDLESAAIKRAAAQAGVDLSSRASINAVDRKVAANQTRAYRSRVGS